MAKLAGFNGLERCLIRFCQVLDYLMSALIFAIFAILLLQVLSRYVFNLPLYWVEELAKYMMIYVTMIGAAIAYHREGHPRLTILYHRFGEPGRLWYELALRVPVAVLLGVLVKVGYGYAESNSWITSPGLQVSFYWPFMGIPIGAACVLVVLALDSLDILFHRRSWLMGLNVPALPRGIDDAAEEYPE
ncbi:TRAP transporter small permease [Poseidonocella sp. HB161398]|uniref:TRAP transporter small permease n=1 Tax=Poseidonocella sp. HB161398 TaxID=2320855 RepID=UPI001107F961|nr:TRAP transporter small permease [Poseidonocella sp. HB161398]